jgi:septal ring factor EnvC (AmiA/AmiB activator)
MSFQDILPYLQNKITDPLTTMELNMIPDTERETLTCEMYLVYEKVKGNPICETQKLLFHRYKTYSERGYEKEIKKFKTDIQRVETENHEMKLLINGHRDVVSNLESMLHEMHTQRSQLEQRLHQSEQHLKRFKDNILQVVYFNENPNESQRSVASEPTNEVALPTGAFCAEKKCESSV